jgi:translation initiation factor 1
METLRLRIERQGRAGKTVTVVAGFTREKALMEKLASELKHALGTGGSWHEQELLLQGDVRERLRTILRGKGFTVKG